MDEEHQTKENDTKNKDSPVLCVAVVRKENSDVVIFDASGKPRTFSYKNIATTGKAGAKLCFSTHGHDADDFLTPCFDEEGNHGEPEESCFCGNDEAHIHAHWHDPDLCVDDDDDDDDEKGGCQAGKKKKSALQTEDALMKLAKLTLEPDDDAESMAMLSLPVSDHMPNQCNANEIDGHGEFSLKNRRRIHKVQHDDHLDHLVFNEKTGVLHLEHEHEECGKDDVHGKFVCIGKRSLKNAADGNDLKLLFFEPVPKPFSIVEFITSHMDVDGGHLAAIRPVIETKTPSPPSCCSNNTVPPLPPPCCASGVCVKAKTDNCCVNGVCTASFLPQELMNDPIMDCDPILSSSDGTKIVRSTLTCTGICCSSEIPGVNRVMDSLEGVHKTMINVPLKQVTVDHDPNIIVAKEIEAALNEARFSATVKRDGGVGVMLAGGGTGKSQFYVEKICCASEIPAINKILEPLEGVTKVSINVTNKFVYVDHDTGTVSAQALCDALNAAAFGATVKKDAGLVVKGGIPAYVTSTLRLDSIDESNAKTIEEFFGDYKSSELETFSVDVATKVVTLKHNPLLLNLSDVVSKLEEEKGIGSTIEHNGADDVEWNFPPLEQSSNNEIDSGESHNWPKPAVILSGIFWIVSMLSFIGGNWEYLKYVALLAVAFGLPGIAIKAFHSLKRYMFDTNCLMLFAALGAVALQEFTEAAAVTFLFALSEWLEVRATARARNALNAVVQLRPEYAFIVHPVTKEQMMVPAGSVPIGAVVNVKTGDKIPCDGVVVEGSSTVDESSLTGESKPVKKGPKCTVSGGTINCGHSHLMIQTTSTSDNSAINRLVSLVEEAQANRSETEQIVEKFAKYYTPVVVFAALCMCTIPWAFGKELGQQWTHNGLVLIVVACPCALIISTPVTYVAGLAATAQRGVLIKGGAHLEALGLVKTICFDKTGTLTQGSFALLSITPIGTKYSRKEILEFLVLMEEKANHPLSLAIVDGARNEGVVAPKDRKVEDHTFVAGEGLTGKIDGLKVHVGNARLFNRLNLMEDLSEELETMISNWEAMAGTVGFMSVEGAGIVCAYCVADAIRSESAEVVESLRKLGINVHMLTGDNRRAATAIGDLVGLAPSGINSELKPEEKLKFITDLKGAETSHSMLSNPFVKKELVCHVGDGVNDAPALAASDIGVAMGVGAALAMETADVTLLDSNLKKLLYSVTMGRRVLWTIKENITFSIIVKALVLAFSVAGKVALWAAIVSDVGAMICVTLNGMKLLPSSKISLEKMGDIENVTYHSQENGTFHSQENGTFRSQENGTFRSHMSGTSDAPISVRGTADN